MLESVHFSYHCLQMAITGNPSCKSRLHWLRIVGRSPMYVAGVMRCMHRCSLKRLTPMTLATKTWSADDFRKSWPVLLQATHLACTYKFWSARFIWIHNQNIHGRTHALTDGRTGAYKTSANGRVCVAHRIWSLQNLCSYIQNEIKWPLMTRNLSQWTWFFCAKAIWLRKLVVPTWKLNALNCKYT